VIRNTYFWHSLSNRQCSGSCRFYAVPKRLFQTKCDRGARSRVWKQAGRPKSVGTKEKERLGSDRSASHIPRFSFTYDGSHIEMVRFDHFLRCPPGAASIPIWFPALPNFVFSFESLRILSRLNRLFLGACQGEVEEGRIAG
jgi:hypothetical protein